jgi:hypothetical protein
MSSPAGAVNAWMCDVCGAITAAVHVDGGTTPMFLACRSTEGCTGCAVSAGYPPSFPDHVLAAIAWEWHTPTSTQMKRWRRTDPAMYEHCRMGGLVLSPLSPAGRTKLKERTGG